jgi:hypothetical protein
LRWLHCDFHATWALRWRVRQRSAAPAWVRTAAALGAELLDEASG